MILERRQEKQKTQKNIFPQSLLSDMSKQNQKKKKRHLKPASAPEQILWQKPQQKTKTQRVLLASLRRHKIKRLNMPIIRRCGIFYFIFFI